MNVTVNINQLVEQLKQMAGPLALHAWEIMVRQQVIAGIQSLVTGAVLLAVAVIALIAAYRLLGWARRYEYTGDSVLSGGYSGEGGMQYIAPTVPVVIAAILVAVAVALVNDGIAHLLNPEYYAIQDVLSHTPGAAK